MLNNITLQKSTLPIFMCLNLYSATALSEQFCMEDSLAADTSTEQFVIDNENGIATDTKTGLSWMVCSYGMSWQADTLSCSGNAQQYEWSDALIKADEFEYANKADWRLPNIKELMSIVERQCSSPAINSTVFVDALAERYWTNSPNINAQGTGVNEDEAWAVSFIDGSNNTPIKKSHSFIRFVRKL